MKKVNLYIESSSAAFQRKARTSGYVLEYITVQGVPVTGQAFLKGKGTYHQETLRVITDALGHIGEPCELCIYGKNRFVLSRIESSLAIWAQEAFMVNGEPRKNREAWQGVWEKIKEHKVSVCIGEHPYSGWLLREMEEKHEETKEHLAGAEE